jgi:hypothetical protein
VEAQEPKEVGPPLRIPPTPSNPKNPFKKKVKKNHIDKKNTWMLRVEVTMVFHWY